MKSYNLRLGALISLFLTLSVVPIRISQGQDLNLVNLIGSEMVIALMIMTMWISIYRVNHHVDAAGWQKIILCALICAALSNCFYWMSNPVFEDYPVKPMRTLPLWLATVRLSIRGILVGFIIIPIVFLTEKQKEIQQVRLQRELERADHAEKQQRTLEALVQKRTLILEQTLSALEASRNELDNQVYILSRVVASITHDVKAPLNYATMISARIFAMMADKEYAVAAEFSGELTRSLSGIGSMMDHLLEFTKAQLSKEQIRQQEVDLAKLAQDKVTLFGGIAGAKNNKVEIDVTEGIRVLTNYNLASVIVHNVMDNATKYTKNGLIRISISQADQGALLRIENTIDSTVRRFAQHSDDDPGNEEAMFESDSKGIGLILVREIAGLLDIGFFLKRMQTTVVADVVFKSYHRQVESGPAVV